MPVQLLPPPSLSSLHHNNPRYFRCCFSFPSPPGAFWQLPCRAGARLRTICCAAAWGQAGEGTRRIHTRSFPSPEVLLGMSLSSAQLLCVFSTKLSKLNYSESSTSLCQTYFKVLKVSKATRRRKGARQHMVASARFFRMTAINDPEKHPSNQLHLVFN